MKRLYVVVRSDIGAGMALAQACHAVASFGSSFPGPFNAWHLGESNIVCLQARNESHLRELFAGLGADALGASFHEPDLDGQMTAFACDRAPKQWSSLPLALKAHRDCYPAACVDNPGL